MASLADELSKRTARDLITSRPEDLVNGSGFVRWRTQVEAFVRGLGPTAASFQDGLRAAASDEELKARFEDLNLINEYAVQRGGTRAYANGWIADGYVGVLEAVIEGIDRGLMTELAVRIASEVYSDVLDEAERLLNAPHLPCAAMLIRVGLENGVRRLAARHSMPDLDKSKVSSVNQWLRKAGVYPLSTERSVEA